MRLALKDGVTFSPSLPMLWALPWVVQAYEIYTELQTVVVTSGNDGEHRNDSLHYEDDALDFRVWGTDREQRASILEYLRHMLGDQYDILDEDDHIHIEWDPK